MAKLIAYDLGTGGVKASLYAADGTNLAKSFLPYETFYPGPNLHEQRPKDWWNGVIESTRLLLTKTDTAPEEVVCAAVSGHSLVAIPVDRDRNLLVEQVPIWSDTRASAETEEFFRTIDQREWYMATGNGFPAPCYSIFKLMWLKKHKPELLTNLHKIVGSKDYINMMLTGKIYTDPSYSSGTGAYDLHKKEMNVEFLAAAGLSPDVFPEIIPSDQIIGTVSKEAAEATGLCEGMPVACGGVDNACMALGAVGGTEGKAYTSLGSSSWIAVNSKEPILDADKKPYVFAHIEKDRFTSAFSIFSGGSSRRWVQETLCRDLADEEDPHGAMDALAAKAPIGAGGVLFNPSLAGGTSQDKSVNIRGAFLGLTLGNTREDMIRATLEGIALHMRLSLDNLKKYVDLAPDMLVCGGGSKSALWMQMFAHVYNMNIVKTNIDQDAASLGAAAVAAKAIGLWEDYSPIDALHQTENKFTPDPECVNQYEQLLRLFAHANEVMADLGDTMKKFMEGSP